VKRSYWLPAVVVLFFLPTSGFAQDYQFDVQQYEKKPFEYSGDLELNPILGEPDQDSRLYRLRFLNRSDENVIEDYDLELDLEGTYRQDPFKLVGEFQLAQRYDELRNWEDDNSVFELYGRYQHTDDLHFTAGRRTYKWGTGYVWNPVSFAGRQKDVNDVTEALKGYESLGVHWTKTYPESKLSTIKADVLYLPVREDINDNFLPGRTNSLISRLHVLYNEIDLSGYLMLNDDSRTRIGADFAYNIESQWEIHGEIAHRRNQVTQFVDSTGSLRSQISDHTNYLLGTRYLTQEETTFILEYFHKGSAFTQQQTNNFYDSIDSVLASPTPASIRQNRQFAKLYNQQIQMQDNLYLRVYHPEPYDILYFTPGFFAIRNLEDDSMNLTLDAKYTRYESLEFHMLYAHLFGDSGTQYGEKIIDDRLELRVRYYF
jgi:hypothetical protein